MNSPAGINIEGSILSRRSGLLACSILLMQSALVLAAWAQTNSDTGSNLPPGIVLDVREELYDVSGHTSAEIYASMRERAPLEVRPFFARHQWEVEWEFRYAVSLERCEMRDVEVWLTSTTILPRWMPGPSPPAGLLHSWNRFMRALREHERGHQRVAVEAARAVRKALREMRTTDCASISSEANSIAEKVLENYLQKDQAYDVGTRHGRTQGAIWPPTD